jgi:hypothetical protein
MARDALAEPGWWAHQLPQRIEGAPRLLKRGQALLEFLAGSGIDSEGLSAVECVVTHTVEAARATEERGTTIRSLPAMLQRLLKDAEERPDGDGENDRLAQVAGDWALTYQAEPLEDRRPVSEWLTGKIGTDG